MAKRPAKPTTNRVASIRKSKNLTQAELGDAIGGVHWTTISNLERGDQKLTEDWLRRLAEALDVRPSELLIEDHSTGSTVTIDGLIGAGGEVDTNVAQAFGGDLAEVKLDIPLPPGLRAYEVWGISMLPKYDPGDVILVQSTADPIDALLGNVGLVVTGDGRRFLKRIQRGSEAGLYDLESFNAPTLKNERVIEAARIYISVPADQVRRPVGLKEISRRFGA